MTKTRSAKATAAAAKKTGDDENNANNQQQPAAKDDKESKAVKDDAKGKESKDDGAEPPESESDSNNDSVDSNAYWKELDVSFMDSAPSPFPADSALGKKYNAMILKALEELGGNDVDRMPRLHSLICKMAEEETKDQVDILEWLLPRARDCAKGFIETTMSEMLQKELDAAKNEKRQARARLNEAEERFDNAVVQSLRLSLFDK